MAKSYEELTFVDDFMFGKIMEDRELCHDLLEYLLGQPVGELQDIQSERQFRYTSDGKPIRLDVYSRDSERMYNAEMQKLNHHTLQDLELPKRSRFYQSVMDTDFLQKGHSYRELLEGRVLFLCTFDPFEAGLAKYTFENRCRENPQRVLPDGTEKIFFNCSCGLENVPEELKALYEYIQDGKESNDLTRRLEEAVKKARLNEKWRSEYMKELLHDDDIRAEGRTEKLVELVCRKLRKGKEAEAIAEDLEEDLHNIIRICEIASNYSPEYDSKKVYEALNI